MMKFEEWWNLEWFESFDKEHDAERMFHICWSVAQQTIINELGSAVLEDALEKIKKQQEIIKEL
jgi:hypothetical protein